MAQPLPESISRSHEAVMRLKFLEPALNDSNSGKSGESLLKRRAHLSIGMHTPEFSQHCPYAFR